MFSSIHFDANCYRQILRSIITLKTKINLIFNLHLTTVDDSILTYTGRMIVTFKHLQLFNACFLCCRSSHNAALIFGDV